MTAAELEAVMVRTFGPDFRAMLEAWSRYRLFCVLDDVAPIFAAFAAGWRDAVVAGLLRAAA